MTVFMRRPRKLTEDDQAAQASQSAASATNAAAAEIERCNQDILKCQNAINIAEQRYQDEKKRQNDNIIQLQQRIVALGGSAIKPATSNESKKMKFKFSKKLYESVVLGGKADELANAVKETFANLPSLSYFMDDKGCMSLAKRLLTFLNDQSWNDGNSHWQEVADFLANTLGKANISLSSREMNQFIDAFGEELKRKTMFSWIFGRDTLLEPAAHDEYEIPQLNDIDDDMVDLHDYDDDLENDSSYVDDYESYLDSLK